jgi:RNA polymerase sigma-70 factor (ECF subfamily)
LLGHEADALDAVQEGFVKALTHLPGFRQQSSFKTWLLRIVTNASLDLGRARRRRGARVEANFPDEDPPAGGPGVGGELDRADLRDALDRALAALPEAQRKTFVLHVDGGLSYREVADVLGISVGTVMSRLYYARQRLKLLLAPRVMP